MLLKRATKEVRVALRAMFSYYCNLESCGRLPGLSDRKIKQFTKDFDVFPRLCTASMIKRLWASVATASTLFLRFVQFLVAVSWDAFNKPFLTRSTPNSTFNSLMEWLMASPKLNEISRHEWMSGRTKRGASISSITSAEARSIRAASPQPFETDAEQEPVFLLATDDAQRRRKLTWGSPFGGHLVERETLHDQPESPSIVDSRKKSLAFGNFAVTGHLGKGSNKCQAKFALTLRKEGENASRRGSEDGAKSGARYKSPWGIKAHVARMQDARKREDSKRDTKEFRRNILSPAALNVKPKRAGAFPSSFSTGASPKSMMQRSPVHSSTRSHAAIPPPSPPGPASALLELASADMSTAAGAELINTLDAEARTSPGRRTHPGRRKSVAFGNFAATGHLGNAGGNKSQAGFALNLRGDANEAKASPVFMRDVKAAAARGVARTIAKSTSLRRKEQMQSQSKSPRADREKAGMESIRGSLDDIIHKNPHLRSSCLGREELLRVMLE